MQEQTLSENLTIINNAVNDMRDSLGMQDASIQDIAEAVAPISNEGKYKLTVIDYDGEIINTIKLNEGDKYTLPTGPTHDRLVFQKWVGAVSISNNEVTMGDYDVVIGPLYTTTSGLNEFDVAVNSVVGMSVTLNFSGTKDWGDGTSDSMTTHTYATPGVYTVKGSGTISSSGSVSIMGGAQDYHLINAYLTSGTIGNGCFTGCKALSTITTSQTVSLSASYQFRYTSGLKAFVMQDARLGYQSFTGCFSLKYLVCSDGVSLDSDTLGNCYNLRMFSYKTGRSGAPWVTSCYNDYALEYYVAGEGTVGITGNGFQNCYGLKYFRASSTFTTLQNNAFNNCTNLETLDFSKCAQVPTCTSSSFTNMSPACKILVPQSLYDTWINTSYWGTRAAQIYPVDSEGNIVAQ